MANLLNFNSNREIGFSPHRALFFDLDRELVFDWNRELGFNPNRDLGFGRRGVLFRGYACANCGATVPAESNSCDECGAVFEEPEVKGAPMKAAVKTSQFERTAPPVPARAATPPALEPRAAPAPPVFIPPVASPAPSPSYVPPQPAAPSRPDAPSATRFCPNCGARSWQGDAWCWNCGARFTEASRVVTASPTGGTVPVPQTAETIQLPPKKARKVAKDWQETGKSLAEYAEEK